MGEIHSCVVNVYQHDFEGAICIQLAVSEDICTCVEDRLVKT